MNDQPVDKSTRGFIHADDFATQDGLSEKKFACQPRNAEYVCSLWESSMHIHKVNPVLNDACRSITGCLQSTNIDNLSTGSNNMIQAVDLSSHSDLQIVVNSSIKTISSTVFRIRVSLHRLS